MQDLAGLYLKSTACVQCVAKSPAPTLTSLLPMRSARRNSSSNHFSPGPSPPLPPRPACSTLPARLCDAYLSGQALHPRSAAHAAPVHALHSRRPQRPRNPPHLTRGPMTCTAGPPHPRRPESPPRTSRAAASAAACVRSLASRTAAASTADMGMYAWDNDEETVLYLLFRVRCIPHTHQHLGCLTTEPPAAPSWELSATPFAGSARQGQEQHPQTLLLTAMLSAPNGMPSTACPHERGTRARTTGKDNGPGGFLMPVHCRQSPVF